MKVGQINHQSFNGLWQSVKYTEPMFAYTHFYEGQHYYPFKDENDYMTSLIKPSYDYETEIYGYQNPYVVGRTKEVSIKEPLKFTYRDYKIYKKEHVNNQPMSETSKMVDRELFDRKLYQYMNTKQNNKIPEKLTLKSILKQLKNVFKSICRK